MNIAKSTDELRELPGIGGIGPDPGPGRRGPRPLHPTRRAVQGPLGVHGEAFQHDRVVDEWALLLSPRTELQQEGVGRLGARRRVRVVGWRRRLVAGAEVRQGRGGNPSNGGKTSTSSRSRSNRWTSPQKREQELTDNGQVAALVKDASGRGMRWIVGDMQSMRAWINTNLCSNEKDGPVNRISGRTSLERRPISVTCRSSVPSCSRFPSRRATSSTTLFRRSSTCRTWTALRSRTRG
jgi:hypothetical protein